MLIRPEGKPAPDDSVPPEDGKEMGHAADNGDGRCSRHRCCLSCSITSPGSINLSIVASGGGWSAYASDAVSDNAGLADFDFDVIADGGLNVTSSTFRAPVQSGSEFTDADYGDADGFQNAIHLNGGGLETNQAFINTLESENGSDPSIPETSNTSSFGILGSQYLVNGVGPNSNLNSPENDETVIQGLGQYSSSQTITDYWNNPGPYDQSSSNNPGPNYTTTAGALWGGTWAADLLIASGKYNGNNGSLTFSVDPDSGGVQVMKIVSNGVWAGPGNVYTITDVPAAVAIVGNGGTGSIGGITSSGTGTNLDPAAGIINASSMGEGALFAVSETTPVDIGYLGYSGFPAGSAVDILLAFGYTNASGDPASGQLLTDLINFINQHNNYGSVAPTTRHWRRSCPRDWRRNIPATTSF